MFSKNSPVNLPTVCSVSLNRETLNFKPRVSYIKICTLQLQFFPPRENADRQKGEKENTNPLLSFINFCFNHLAQLPPTFVTYKTEMFFHRLDLG